MFSNVTCKTCKKRATCCDTDGYLYVTTLNPIIQIWNFENYFIYLWHEIRTNNYEEEVNIEVAKQFALEGYCP